MASPPAGHRGACRAQLAARSRKLAAAQLALSEVGELPARSHSQTGASSRWARRASSATASQAATAGAAAAQPTATPRGSSLRSLGHLASAWSLHVRAL